MVVSLYTKSNCMLCDEAHAILSLLKMDYSFEIEEYDIEGDDRLLEEYQLQIPVIKVGDSEWNAEEISYVSLANTLSKMNLKQS